MCLLIYSETGFNAMDYAMQQEIYNRNPDGFGFSFLNNEGKLVAEKGLFSPEQIEQLLEMLPNDRPVLAHWRMGTHGTVTDELCHPYQVNNDLVMFHNGVLHNFAPKKSKGTAKGNQGADASLVMNTNDTVNFMNEYMRPALMKNPKLWADSEFKKATEKIIGKNNKLAFMDSDGLCTLYNYNEWEEYKGILFSNDYAWPYEEYVLGISYEDIYRMPNGAVIDDSMPVMLDDLVTMSHEEILEFVKQYPEEAANIIYYDIEISYTGE